MNDFFKKKWIITQIILAIFVPIGTGNLVHKNRPSHGLALNCDGEKKFIFSDGTVCNVCKNDLIYLPKNSNYEIETAIPGDTWCSLDCRKQRYVETP